MIVFGIGVRVRGFTRAKIGGSIRSRPIVKRMRVCPYMTTSVMLKIEMTAPAASTVLGHVDPVTSSRI